MTATLTSPPTKRSCTFDSRDGPNCNVVVVQTGQLAQTKIARQNLQRKTVFEINYLDNRQHK